MKRNSVLTLCLLIGFYSTAAFAKEPYNYYLPAPNHILESVEKAHLPQGIEKSKHGKYEYAWGEFAAILHYFPNHPKALEQLCELSLQMEQPLRAEKYFERAIKTFPEQPQTHVQYGVFLDRIGKPDAAISHYEQALALNMVTGELYHRLSRAYLANEDYQHAEFAAKMAKRLGYVANHMPKDE